MLIMSETSFGQGYDLIETETETYYRLLKDSIDPKLDYPDGRYKLFQSDTNRLPTHVFHIEEGNIHGPYIELDGARYTLGNYHKDSLWTFVTNPRDTTFKIGTWRNTYTTISGFSGKYDNHTSVRQIFKMPYDTTGEFTEVWLFSNGQLAREATFQKGFGLEKETHWDFENNEIVEQTINSGNQNYYQSILYRNDSIASVSLIQRGIHLIIDFDYSFGCENRPCTNVSVYRAESEINGNSIVSMSIDSANTLTRFSDWERFIHLAEEDDGSVLISYPNKKGKRKRKRLK
jgi:hypothetical protein